MPSRVEIVTRAIAPVRADVVDHPITRALADAKSLVPVRTFMEHHVYAVWDFMWLLSALRQRFTCPGLPWVPPDNRVAARLVNEIALGEESDLAPDGQYCSHFDWYRAAMREVGADTSVIDDAVAKATIQFANPVTAMIDAGAPAAAVRFSRQSWEFAGATDATLVGAFCFGRETLIPAMFAPLMVGTDGLLLAYLERHIEIDGEHGPMTEHLVTEVCQTDPAAWLQLIAGARAALVARRRLWDDTLQAIQQTGPR